MTQGGWGSGVTLGEGYAVRGLVRGAAMVYRAAGQFPAARGVVREPTYPSGLVPVWSQRG